MGLEQREHSPVPPVVANLDSAVNNTLGSMLCLIIVITLKRVSVFFQSNRLTSCKVQNFWWCSIYVRLSIQFKERSISRIFEIYCKRKPRVSTNLITFPTSSSGYYTVSRKIVSLFLQQTNNSLKNIYFWNFILLYIPWIVIFFEFTNTKIDKTPTLLQPSSSLWFVIPIWWL